MRAVAGERDRVLAGTAAEVEDALALHVAAQAQVGVGRQVRSVRNGVGRDRIAGTPSCGDAVPNFVVHWGYDLRHPWLRICAWSFIGSTQSFVTTAL